MRKDGHNRRWLTDRKNHLPAGTSNLFMLPDSNRQCNKELDFQEFDSCPYSVVLILRCYTALEMDSIQLWAASLPYNYWCHSLYNPGCPRAQLGSGWVQAGAFTSAVWTGLESEDSPHYHCQHIICLLYSKSKALCSRQLMTQTKPSHVQLYSGAGQLRLASVLGWPCVNALSHAQPKLSP